MTERCQRIGCNAVFSPEDNAEDSCRYHPGPPLFHDGGKEWKCCKQRSHDFTLFLEIPGCSTGKHTSEKPQTTFTSSTKKACVAPVREIGSTAVSREACSRCRQGFFCSDHGVQPAVHSSLRSQSPLLNTDSEVKHREEPRVLDFNAEQTCKNCKKTFTEMENHDTACEYHAGPPIFHDRSRGWACCDVHVKEFDEFLAIPPCTKGWHQGI